MCTNLFMHIVVPSQTVVPAGGAQRRCRRHGCLSCCDAASQHSRTTPFKCCTNAPPCSHTQSSAFPFKQLEGAMTVVHRNTDNRAGAWRSLTNLRSRRAMTPAACNALILHHIFIIRW